MRSPHYEVVKSRKNWRRTIELVPSTLISLPIDVFHVFDRKLTRIETDFIYDWIDDRSRFREQSYSLLKQSDRRHLQFQLRPNFLPVEASLYFQMFHGPLATCDSEGLDPNKLSFRPRLSLKTTGTAIGEFFKC